jgi:hypothetical protein
MYVAPRTCTQEVVENSSLTREAGRPGYGQLGRGGVTAARWIRMSAKPSHDSTSLCEVTEKLAFGGG